jgi:hypothetical protein
MCGGIIRDIGAYRTADLGGSIKQCDGCPHEVMAYSREQSPSAYQPVVWTSTTAAVPYFSFVTASLDFVGIRRVELRGGSTGGLLLL